MKICDRHFKLDGSSVQAVEQIALASSDERYDLCQSCSELLRDFISNPKEIDGTKRTVKTSRSSKKKDA